MREEEKQEKELAVFILEVNRFMRNCGQRGGNRLFFPVLPEKELRSVSGLGARGRQVTAHKVGFSN